MTEPPRTPSRFSFSFISSPQRTMYSVLTILSTPLVGVKPGRAVAPMPHRPDLTQARPDLHSSSLFQPRPWNVLSPSRTCLFWARHVSRSSRSASLATGFCCSSCCSFLRGGNVLPWAARHVCLPVHADGRRVVPAFRGSCRVPPGARCWQRRRSVCSRLSRVLAQERNCQDSMFGCLRRRSRPCFLHLHVSVVPSTAAGAGAGGVRG